MEIAAAQPTENAKTKRRFLAVSLALGPRLAATSVRWSGEFDRAALETIVRSREPYVAATTADGNSAA
jgi:hypothetical protein